VLTINNLKQESTNIPEINELAPNSRGQNGDIRQLHYDCAPTVLAGPMNLASSVLSLHYM
jgi:hypothetical protein